MIVLTDYQYSLFAGYALYKALGCETLAEIFRANLIKELKHG